jgi:hypothetical protein
MGSDIYNEYPEAKRVMDECEEVLGARLRNIMFEGPQVGNCKLSNLKSNS